MAARSPQLPQQSQLNIEHFESNQRTECVVASVGGCGGQTGAEAAALLAVLGDVGLGSWRILRSAVPASA